MNRKRTGYGILLLLILMVCFVASCGFFGRSEEPISKGTPIPTGEPPVAYGASLDEWEEATQADDTQANAGQVDTDQTSSRKEWPVVETQPVSPLAYLAPISPLAVPAASEPEPEPELESVAGPIPEIGTPYTLDNIVYREILWDGLIPADFTADAIMSKYEDQLAEMEDGSPEASELYQKMQAEFNRAPVNEILDEKLIRIPGFIAPLDYTDDRITEFLLVPYFGACIHVPPPPANQTVLISTAEGQGIKPEDSNSPIWVMGKLSTEGTTTELAAAGYYMEEAIIEPYMNTR